MISSLLQRRTPAQLLWMIGASSALVSIGFAVLNRTKGFHLTLWCASAALILGMVGSLVAEQSLRDGVNSEQWPDSLLPAPRKFMLRRASYILGGLLLLCAVAYWIYSILAGMHNISGVWMLLFPTMTLARVLSYLRPKPGSDRLFGPIEQPKPLQSQNWGAPPRPFSS